MQSFAWAFPFGREMIHGDASEAFTLSDLRRLHQQGQLSDDEFERAKQALLGVAGVSSVKPAPSMRPINTVPDEDTSELGEELLPPYYDPRDDAPGKNE
ncbi:MAG: SHOCT domain-containing protein [Planctomycetota bacterium]|jgi:hypothetical protein